MTLVDSEEQSFDRKRAMITDKTWTEIELFLGIKAICVKN